MREGQKQWPCQMAVEAVPGVRLPVPAASRCRFGGNRLPVAIPNYRLADAKPELASDLQTSAAMTGATLVNSASASATSFDWPAAFGPFLDPIALALVLGGTGIAVALRTPARDFGRGLAALRVLFRGSFTADPMLKQIEAFDRIARRHGLLALDRAVIDDPDVAVAVAAAVDGAKAETIDRLLAERAAARTERHEAAAEMWAAVAEAAPAMGMVGTLVGLVRMFTSMSDTQVIGQAMAVALLATLYGAVFASLVGLPIASRLRRRAQEEERERMRLAIPLASLALIGRPRIRDKAA